MKPTLYILCGVPGCGKSFYAENFRHDGLTISRDQIRFGLLNDEEDYFSKEDQVFNRFITMIHGNLKRGIPVMADATHLNKRSRAKLINKLHLQNVEKIIILYFKVPYELLEQRNAARGGKQPIPFIALENMYNSMDVPSVEENPLFEIWEIDGYGYIKPGE